MDSGIEDRLRAHSSYFQTLVALIPAQYYGTREAEDEAGEIGKSKRGTRFWHNKKGAGEALQKSRKSTAHGKEPEEDSADATASEKKKQFSVESVRSTSLSDLRERLQKKISEVSQSRGTETSETTETKKRKRRRRKDGEDGSDRKVKKLEKKQKHRERVKRAAKSQEAKQKRAIVAVAGDSSRENSSQLSFSRFEFGGKSKTAIKKKDYHTLIARAENKQKKLHNLMEQDQERGEVAQEKDKWSKAVRMARGEKMKDDPKLLKKTVKRLEKKKKRSKVKWQERVKAEHKRQEAKQKTRKQNIRERVDKIKAKKTRKRAKKRGIV